LIIFGAVSAKVELDSMIMVNRLGTIYRLAIQCVAGVGLDAPFLRVAEVASDSTLADLHGLILLLAGFEDDHLSTFYLANTIMGQRVWLVEPDEWDPNPGIDGGGPLWHMSLADVFPLPKHKKLYYWFDFGDDWIFEIRKKGKDLVETPGSPYPRLIEEEGPQPEQYPDWEE
jgi:hypothetical protein